MFLKSPLAGQLQQALVARKDQLDSWLDDWWYDAYCEIRGPLVPYLSLASIQPRAPRAIGSQICRAADSIYHMLKVWESLRKQTYPVMKSRGVIWDMNQNLCLFNAARVPQRPKDQMARYFKTEEQGACPSHIVILCRGNIWELDVMKNGALKSVDELYRAFEFVRNNSTKVRHSVATLTTEHRDTWADMRTHLQKLSSKNAENLLKIESSIFAVVLTDDEILEENELLVYSMMGQPDGQWADKNMNISIMKDGQITTQADHSNVDAIVVLDAGNISGRKIRHHVWTPNDNADFEKPTLINFEFGQNCRKSDRRSRKEFLQASMQIAFRRVHGSYAPIYETASTRKFYLGRTETIRSRTPEAVAFINALLESRPVDELRHLFKAAYDAHNRLMAEAMEGNGCDRHLYGLRKTLESMNKGSCNPKRGEPKIFQDKAWKHSGGDGNFKLSTSFIGYDKFGSYGYVSAMCPDGYGSFYRIHDDGMLLTASNFTSGASNLDEYTKNIAWAMDRIGEVLGVHQAKL
ncbi:unnamed protein product, partial [Mesorhabditis spiculigera]